MSNQLQGFSVSEVPIDTLLSYNFAYIYISGRTVFYNFSLQNEFMFEHFEITYILPYHNTFLKKYDICIHFS